jgi:predicted DNA-binding transcriptional regulator AlpA
MAHQILRPAQAAKKLGVGRSTFYESYVKPGLIHLLQLGKNSTGCLESEVDRLIETFPPAPPGPAVFRTKKTKKPDSIEISPPVEPRRRRRRS